jgi:hypothetical protein
VKGQSPTPIANDSYRAANELFKDQMQQVGLKKVAVIIDRPGILLPKHQHRCKISSNRRPYLKHR